jgi:hypothetical protein
MELLKLKINILKRQAVALQREIEQWVSYTAVNQQFEKNASQLGVLYLFMQQVLRRLQQDVQKVERLLQKRRLNTADVLNYTQTLEQQIIRAYNIWSFFRSKLEQRFMPQFSNLLYLTDIIAYDCYNAIRINANNLQLKHTISKQAYPLTYLLNGYSPLTLPKYSMPEELDEQLLPLPLVGIPSNLLANPWELLTLAHEVAHNLDGELNQFSNKLGILIEHTLISKAVPSARAHRWRQWMSEIFADFLSALLVGPVFVTFLASYMVQPNESINFQTDSHPPPFLRILLNVSFMKVLLNSSLVSNYINQMLHNWNSLYGQPSSDIEGYKVDFETVIDLILFSPQAALEDTKGNLHSLSELIQFRKTDFDDQLVLADYLHSDVLTDYNALSPRHTLGAAYLAWERHFKVNNYLEEAWAIKLTERLRNLILAKAPPGQLDVPSEETENHVYNLADRYFDRL